MNGLVGDFAHTFFNIKYSFRSLLLKPTLEDVFITFLCLRHILDTTSPPLKLLVSLTSFSVDQPIIPPERPLKGHLE